MYYITFSLVLVRPFIKYTISCFLLQGNDLRVLKSAASGKWHWFVWDMTIIGHNLERIIWLNYLVDFLKDLHKSCIKLAKMLCKVGSVVMQFGQSMHWLAVEKELVVLKKGYHDFSRTKLILLDLSEPLDCGLWLIHRSNI